MIRDITVLVAGHGLVERRAPIVGSPLSDRDWTALLRDVGENQLTGHLVRAIEEGAFPVTRDQHDLACAAHERQMHAAVCLERVLLTVDATLRERGIEYRVLKGPALAHTIYADPGERSFGDIDVLFRARDVEPALALMTEVMGFRRRFPELRAGFVERFGKGATLETPNGYEVDVHRTLAAGPYGVLADPDDLFGAATTFMLAGRPLQGLAAGPRFLHACLTAAIGSTAPRLVSMRDVAQIALCTELETCGVLEMTDRWSARAVVASALRTTWDTLHLGTPHPLVEWAEEYAPTRREQKWMGVYVGGQRSYASQTLAALWVTPGVSEKLAYAYAVLVPDREFMATRQGGYVHRAGTIARFALRQIGRRLRD